MFLVEMRGAVSKAFQKLQRVMSQDRNNNKLSIQLYNRCVRYYYGFIRYEPYR